MRMASEMVVQANSIKAMYEMPTIESITATANALNSYGVEFSDKMKETYSRISEDLKSFVLMEDDEELPEIDSNDSIDENP